MQANEAKKDLKKLSMRFALSLAATALLIVACLTLDIRAASPTVSIDLSAGDAQGSFGILEMLFLLMVLALAPSILIMMTSFTRIVIVLSFLRNALGTQQSPPNQVIIGLSLFLTLFIMTPTINEIGREAYIPYSNGEITSAAAFDNAITPLKRFMLRQTYQKDLSLFLNISGRGDMRLGEEDQTAPADGELSRADGNLEQLTGLGLEVIVPSFVTSELKRAFEMGFLLFIPFLIIDMVVSSTLMSMGMVMLPPSMIALPFKIMMFVLVDGWGLLLGTLARSFR